MIVYEGPSLLDGSSIVVIATFGSRNKKTGGMVQVWILPADQSPLDAIASGKDYSVCGDCPHRPAHLNTCYVLVWREVMRVWRTYQAGKYEAFNHSAFVRRRVRFGAWGDPAAVPMSAWLPILEVCNVQDSTGYTHQAEHPAFDPAIANFCQISVETTEQARRAQDRGHKTYRVMTQGEELLPGEVICDNATDSVQCDSCGRCDGKTSNVAIPPHGARARILARAA